MTWLPTILTVFHVIVSIFLILVVLLQQGKSADWSGAFGGGGTQTAFGSRGSGTVLSKATTAAAIIFMITSLSLAILISRPGGSSVVREGAKQQNAPQPAQPAQPGQPAQPAQPGQQTPGAPQQQQQNTPAQPATPPAQEKK
jgi:preprotein translocase subunit SecG